MVTPPQETVDIWFCYKLADEQTCQEEQKYELQITIHPKVTPLNYKTSRGTRGIQDVQRMYLYITELLEVC